MSLSKLALLLLITFLISCNDENYTINNDGNIKIISNRKPSNPQFDFKLKEEVVFNSTKIDTFKTSKLNGIFLNSKNEIFAFDDLNYKIHKFDKYGNYVKSFGGHGQGPYEFAGITTMALVDDKIFINSLDNNKVSLFNSEGKGIKEIQYSNNSNSLGFINSYNGFIISYTNGLIKSDENSNLYSYQNYDLYNKELNKLKVIFTDKTLLSNSGINDIPNPPNISVARDGSFYRSDYNYNDYKIDKFNPAGQKELVINKLTTKIPYSEKHIKKSKARNKKLEFKQKIEKFKSQIKYITIDTKNYLWVKPNLAKKTNHFVYDIFKNGIYLNRIQLPIDKNNSIDFCQGKLIICNKNSNIIKIYSYEGNNR